MTLYEHDHLLLDSSIRDWVVLPIVVMLVLVGIGRHYVNDLIKTVPVITDKEMNEIRYKQTLSKAAR